jgi:hypothetical protein
MDRIDEVVKVLNANLLYVGNITDYNAFGIAEKVNRGEQVLLYEKTALGVQNGISINDSKRVTIFHTLKNIQSKSDNERGSGGSPKMVETYDLSLFTYYSNITNTITSKELLEIAKLAFPVTLSKSNKEALQISKITFEVTDSSFDKHDIFENVFTKQKNNLSDNSILVQIDYQVTMEFNRNCIPYLPCDLSEYDIEIQNSIRNCADIKDCIGIIESGSSVKYLNQQGDFVTVDSIDDIAGLIEAGSNITIIGSGTIADPYVISSSAGGGTWGSITGTLSNQTDLQTALDGKVDENSAIVGATKTKITYDTKGLVTAGDDATTADINDSTDRRYVTDDELTIVENIGSTGILTGGVISIGTGGAGVATTFSITAGTGQIINNTVDPSTITPVTWTVKTDVAVTNILTQLVTFIAIDSGGNVIQSTTDFTPAQMRQYIVIGVVVHSNLITINAVNQGQIVAYNQGNQLTDLMYSIGLFNVTGNVFSPNGANLKINKSAGSIFRRGANYSTLSDNPHLVTTASLTQGAFRMQNQTGAGGASVTDIDVANYDVGGVTTVISPSTRFSVLRIYLFQSNLIAVQRGQAIYNSLAEAKASIQTENYVTNSVLLANGLLRGFLVVQANATDLSIGTKAFFIEAGKFGGSSGVGGLSVSTMQNTYDNSSDPEILTDSTRGAVTFKRGSASDTDDVFEILNNAGTQKFAVTGNGKVFTASETASRIASINAGQELESLDTTTYPDLVELSRVKGVTSAIQTQLDSKQATLSIASDAEMQTGTDNVKYTTALRIASWWTWIKTQVATISAIWTFSAGIAMSGGRFLLTNTSTASGDGFYRSAANLVKWCINSVDVFEFGTTLRSKVAHYFDATMFTNLTPTAISIPVINTDGSISANYGVETAYMNISAQGLAAIASTTTETELTAATSLGDNTFLAVNNFTNRMTAFGRSGVIGMVATNTYTFAVRFGPAATAFASRTVVATTGAISAAALTAQGWKLDGIFSIKTHSASAVVNCAFELKVNGQAIVVVSTVTSASIDTTVDNVLTVTIDYGTSSASNTCTLHQEYIYKLS